MNKNIFILISIIISCSLFANEKVSVQLLWKHQFEFAGIYIAKHKGFYKDAGLDVKIKEYKYGIDISKDVIDQKTTFGIGYSSIVLKGNDIVMLDTFLQSSPHILVTTNPNIKTIKDFKNKTIMINNDAIEAATIKGMLNSKDVVFDDLKIINPSFNINDLINKRCDLMTAYMSNEIYTLDKQNITYKIFDPSDYGFDFYSDILYTSSKYAKQNANNIKKFRDATKKGWLWAFNHIEEAVDIIFFNYKTHKTKDGLLYEAGILKNLAFDKSNEFGKIRKGKIKEIYNTYYMLGLIKKDVNFNDMIFDITYKEPITPIPLNPIYDHKKAQLGKKLFYDTRLSGNNTINCATCHILEIGGDDNMQFSTGINGSIGNINSPTVLNARYNIAQFWDGRAKDLKEQAMGPIENPIEMGNHFNILVKTLKKDHQLLSEFNTLYKDGITKENIADAIAQFEKALTTPNGPFDRYLKGDKSAISDKAKDGYRLFKQYGCINCHNGINVGANLFQKVGIFRTFSTKVKSLGLMSLTGDVIDKNYFKVPTLRNISQTAPYFHSGDIDTLEKAVKVMGLIQVGINIPKKDIDKIVEFLKTLDGNLPKIIQDNL